MVPLLYPSTIPVTPSPNSALSKLLHPENVPVCNVKSVPSIFTVFNPVQFSKAQLPREESEPPNSTVSSFGQPAKAYGPTVFNPACPTKLVNPAQLKNAYSWMSVTAGIVTFNSPPSPAKA